VQDDCVGISVAPGGSCTIAVVFHPASTGARTSTLSLTDNGAGSPQGITLSGTGTSTAGPTPISISTFGLDCSAGPCDLGSSTIVGDFGFASFGAAGEFTLPLTWSLAGGVLPPGLTLFPDSELYGTATTVGSSVFTLRVTDAVGRTATRAFRLGVVPRPVAGDPGCQHAPSQSVAQLGGPAIAGRAPSGRAIGDQSKLTACGGFVTISVSVSNVNLPNGTTLWVSLGARPIGLIHLSGGAGSIPPFVLDSDLRKKGIQISTAPPVLTNVAPPVLFGSFV
jgi:hypothetical protein